MLQIPMYASAAELFDAALTFGRRYFGAIVRAALPALAVVAVIQLAGQVLHQVPFVPVVEFVAYTMAWAGAEAAAIALCWQVVHGHPAGVAIWSSIAPHLWTIVIGYTLKWLLILAGLILLIAPGIYLIALYFAVPTVIIAERRSLAQAFRRTRAPARPGMMRIVMTLGVLELGSITLSTVASALLASPSGATATPAGLLVGWLIGVSLLPFRATMMTLLYVDRRVRREGYDLEVALATMDRAS